MMMMMYDGNFLTLNADGGLLTTNSFAFWLFFVCISLTKFYENKRYPRPF
jgi:hypothetical protein